MPNNFFSEEKRQSTRSPLNIVVLRTETIAKVHFGNEKPELPLDFRVLVSYFEAQRILTVLVYTRFPQISLDDLIFLKQAKWYRTTNGTGWALTLKGNDNTLESFHQLLLDVLIQGTKNNTKNQECYKLFVNHDWPIFDFIELRNVGPAVTDNPNKLTLKEHWGLLSGDEGYRLVDPVEGEYTKILKDKKMQFKGRDYFLYHFAPTSCICFLHESVDKIRRCWGDYYRAHVADIPTLDRYISFNASVPCIQDGIPLLVEVCLLRYIELCRVDAELAKALKAPFWKKIWNRLSGVTPLEQVVKGLDDLDLYQDSALWIVGGPYTEQLFKYSEIRSRLDRAVQNTRTIASESVGHTLAFWALVVALFVVLIDKGCSHIPDGF